MPSFSDDFNRAGPGFGPNWDDIWDGSAEIAGNQAIIVSGAGNSCLIWQTPAADAAEFSEFTVTADWTNNTSLGPVICSDGADETSGYQLNYRALDARWRIWRDGTQINNVNGGPVVEAGDVVRIESEVDGSDLIVRTYHNGNLVNEVTDTSPLTGRHVGFILRTGCVSGDDWSGGDVGGSGGPTDLSGTGAVVAPTAGTGVVTGHAAVAGVGATVDVVAGVGPITAQTDLTGVGAVIELVAGVGPVTGVVVVTGVGATITPTAGTGTLTAQADVTGTGAVIGMVAGVGPVDTGTVITATGAVITSVAGHGTITAGADIAGSGARIAVVAGIGPISGPPTTHLAGVGARLELVAGIGPVSGSATLAGIGAVIGMIAGVGRIVGSSVVQVNRRDVVALRMNGRTVVDARINGRHILTP